MKTEHVSLITAKRLAKFFLSHPLVTNVYLFGSTAMWGDGNDIDLVIEVKNKKIPQKFLETLKKESEGINKKLEQWFKKNKAKPKDLYGELKALRKGLVLKLLRWQNKTDEFTQICWNDKWAEWDKLCRRGCGAAAERIEDMHYREVDLFLLPVGWQGDKQIKQALPTWRNRPYWGRINFLTVVKWQSMRFDLTSETFCSRKKLQNTEELVYKRLRKNARRRWLRN